MANKKTTYNPAPVDADGDGIVQEDTLFERPVKATTHVVAEGDTYASLGKTYATYEETFFSAAQRIMQANNGRTLTVGSIVNI